MARTDNLKNFLTDVTNSIRGKTKNPALIDVSELDDVIENIPSTVTAPEKKTVRLYNYNGNLINSYTKTEFLALSAYPSLPSLPSELSGKISQRNWVYPLSTAQSMVTKFGSLDTGVAAVSSKDMCVLVVLASNTLSPSIKITGGGNNVTVTVYWGDGTSNSVTVDEDEDEILSHTYSKTGSYYIEIDGNGSYIIGKGTGTSSKCGFLYDPNGVVTFNTTPRHIYLKGSNIKLGQYCFSYCNNAQFISCSLVDLAYASHVFYSCQLISSIIIEGSRVGSRCFNSNSSVKTFIIGGGPDLQIGDYGIASCGSIQNFYLLNNSSSASIGSSIVYSGSSIRKIAIFFPNLLSSVSIGAFFNGCYSLEEALLDIPNLTTFPRYMFSGCYNLKKLDLSTLNQVPAYNSGFGDPFVSTLCKIIVPDSLYQTWITTTGWSNIASHIIKKSDWDALNN